MHCNSALHPLLTAAASLVLLLGGAGSARGEAANGPRAASLCEAAGVTGGLCVMVGCDDSRSACWSLPARDVTWSMSWIATRPPSTESARELQEADSTGWRRPTCSAAEGKLPYTENLVNVVFLGERRRGRIPLAEVARVLRPDGVLFIAARQAAGSTWT